MGHLVLLKTDVTQTLAACCPPGAQRPWADPPGRNPGSEGPAAGFPWKAPPQDRRGAGAGRDHSSPSINHEYLGLLLYFS